MWYKNKVLLSLLVLTLVFTLSFGMTFNDYLVFADEVSEVPVDDPEGEVPVDDPEGEVPVDDPEGEVPVDDPEGEVPVDDPEGEVPVDDPEGEVPVDDPEGEVPVDDPEGEVPVDDPEGEVPVDDPEGEVPVDDPEGEVPVDDPEGEVPVDDPEGEVPVDDPEGEVPVDDPEGEVPVDDPEGEVPVDDPEGEVPVDDPEGEVPVDDPEGEVPVDDPEGEVPVDDPEGEVPVDDPEGEVPVLTTEEMNLITVEPSLELSMITLDKEFLEGFDSKTYKYEIKLPEGSTILPKVTGLPVTEDMIVSYDIDESNSIVRIQVGPNENCAIYELRFIGLELAEEVEAPIGVWGMWLPPTEDDFVLEKRSTKIRFWMQTPILYPAIWIYEIDDQGELDNKVLEISTSDLKINNGGGKHSNVNSVTTFDEGYYQFNLKGKNCTALEAGQVYALVVINGDEIVEFNKGEPAILEFEVDYESNNTVIKERNKDYNESSRRSNVSGNR